MFVTKGGRMIRFVCGRAFVVAAQCRPAAAFLVLRPPGPLRPPSLTCVFLCWVRLSDRLQVGRRVSEGRARNDQAGTDTHEKKRPQPSQSHPNGFSDVWVRSWRRRCSRRLKTRPQWLSRQACPRSSRAEGWMWYFSLDWVYWSSYGECWCWCGLTGESG